VSDLIANLIRELVRSEALDEVAIERIAGGLPDGDALLVRAAWIEAQKRPTLSVVTAVKGKNDEG